MGDWQCRGSSVRDSESVFITHSPMITQAHVSKVASVQSCPSVVGAQPRAQIPGGQAEGGPGLSGGQGTSVRTPRPSVRRFLHCALTAPAWGSPFSCLGKPVPPLSHLPGSPACFWTGQDAALSHSSQPSSRHLPVSQLLSVTQMSREGQLQTPSLQVWSVVILYTNSGNRAEGLTEGRARRQLCLGRKDPLSGSGGRPRGGGSSLTWRAGGVVTLASL